MERRTFLVKAGVLFSMPLIITEIGCSDNNNESSIITETSGNNSDSFTVISSSVDYHTHTVSIFYNDVDNPPSSNQTLKSSSSSGHTHNITLSENHFQRLAAGETINRTSTVYSAAYSGSGHSHTFSIRVP